MARIGLDNFLIGTLTEAADGTATYSAATKPGKAISCNVAITNNDASLYADDALAESDRGFQSGTVTMGIDDDDVALQALILGCTNTDGELVRSTEDVAPYVGFGRIVTKQVNNAYKYVVKFLCKVKFSMPSSDENTKGESIEFGTTEYEGTVSALANGEWSKEKVFDTKAAAKTYLESLFGTTTSV